MLQIQTLSDLQLDVAAIQRLAVELKTLIATHCGSLHPHYQANLLTTAYTSDLIAIIGAVHAKPWVHGREHTSLDYRVVETRALCNPHSDETEHPDFDLALVAEVAP